MAIRQPVVSVLGHVDHGKTRLLDAIRGTSVRSREAGSITQHIGATEVPIDHIHRVCSKLIGKKRFAVPGLLFIDTPGHHSFMTLRARGGSLADIAVLVIDVREGLKPQTIESIRILRQHRTPFVVALNKIDAIPGWKSMPGTPFVISERSQGERALETFNERMYKIIGDLSTEGINADRYDRIEDFTKTVALVPLSAKEEEGVQDLLLVLIGLAQRFLEGRLAQKDDVARGTVLEIKEEKGLGHTLDTILYTGTLRKGDAVAIGTESGEPLITRVKAILKPKPLDEIRDPRDRFDFVDELHAAAGVKIACQSVEGVMSGAPMVAVVGSEDEAIRELTEETAINVETEEKGVCIKADAIGSLEALAYEAKAAGIPVRKYGIGNITRRDVVDAAAHGDLLNRTILGFNVALSKDAETAMEGLEVNVFTNPVVYRLMEEYVEWSEEAKRKSDTDLRSSYPFPGKVMIMPNCVFRVSKPAIVGVRVLAGRIRPNQRLLSTDGRVIGKIRSIRSGEDAVRESVQGDEVAIAIDDVTIGRQAKEGDVLLVDLHEGFVKSVAPAADLNEDETMAMQEVVAIKRREEPFWGM
ncbi:MAG: translation initiation factor IF-2 [Thermoplasmatales archaeon]|nr:translation initiation factor IF-2 [Thermoplasmatales archaeon]